MKKNMIRMGVDENDIITEENSLNTHENISNLLPMINSMDFKTLLLVTSSSHMFRSLAVCKRNKVHVYPAPVLCYEKDINSIFSRIRFTPEIFREYLAIAYYWFKGWI